MGIYAYRLPQRNGGLIMIVTIEIDNSLVGYRIMDDNNLFVHFENLPRTEQIKILNSFADGYRLFIEALKED